MPRRCAPFFARLHRPSDRGAGFVQIQLWRHSRTGPSTRRAGRTRVERRRRAVEPCGGAPRILPRSQNNETDSLHRRRARRRCTRAREACAPRGRWSPPKFCPRLPEPRSRRFVAYVLGRERERARYVDSFPKGAGPRSWPAPNRSWRVAVLGFGGRHPAPGGIGCFAAASPFVATLALFDGRAKPNLSAACWIGRSATANGPLAPRNARTAR
jgi:hypothetical protein